MKRTHGSNYIGEVIALVLLLAGVCATWHAIAGGNW